MGATKIIKCLIKLKRSTMLHSDGFKARFYKLSEFLVPSLAWGFLGSDNHLQALMMDFQDQIMDFVKGIYNSDIVRFTTVEVLSQDIMLLAKQKFRLVELILNSSGRDEKVIN